MADRLRPRRRPVFSGFTKAEIEIMEDELKKKSKISLDENFCKYLARRFNCSSGRAGKPVVKWSEVLSWFQNKLQICQAKVSSSPCALSESCSLNIAHESPAIPNGNKALEFEARSAKDGAWFDVKSFLAHRYNCSGDSEALIRFSGFGPEEDEWVNVKNSVRLRSVPFENLECRGIKVGDPILCLQVTRSRAMFYDAHVLEVQRRDHDLRGCRCQFLIRYDHDNTEERVQLKRLCRIQMYYSSV